MKRCDDMTWPHTICSDCWSWKNARRQRKIYFKKNFIKNSQKNARLNSKYFNFVAVLPRKWDISLRYSSSPVLSVDDIQYITMLWLFHKEDWSWRRWRQSQSKNISSIIYNKVKPQAYGVLANNTTMNRPRKGDMWCCEITRLGLWITTVVFQ